MSVEILINFWSLYDESGGRVRIFCVRPVPIIQIKLLMRSRLLSKILGCDPASANRNFEKLTLTTNNMQSTSKVLVLGNFFEISVLSRSKITSQILVFGPFNTTENAFMIKTE